MASTEFVLTPEAGTPLQVLQDTVRVLANGDQTCGAYEVFELTGKLHSGPLPHQHPWDEAFYILEGEVEILMQQQWVTATPGYFVNIPRNTVHTYRIQSPTARLLVITAAAGAAAFFEEMDREFKDQELDMETVLSVANRHRITAAIAA